MVEKTQKNPLLIDAVIKSDLDLVKYLITQGTKLDARDDGVTALYEAVQCSYEEIALTLIKAGANIQAKNRRGKSILMEAIMRKQSRVVQELLVRGADVHARSRGGRNALMEAAIFSSPDLIYQLVAVGASIEENDFESLAQAVAFKSVEGVRTLLELGADPNAYKNRDGTTLLMMAVNQECEQIIELLVEHGADIYAKNDDDLNALDIAHEAGFSEIANFLKPYFGAS